MQTDKSCVMVIFGSTGDLATRKIFPALYNLYLDNFLPERFAVVAMGRRPKNQQQFLSDLRRSVEEHSRCKIASAEDWDTFARFFSYFQADIYADQEYGRLKSYIEELRQEQDIPANILFYLAVAPEHFVPIVSNLEQSGLVVDDKERWQRVVIEKPFGTDLDSAGRLNEQLRRVFAEEEIYRIDHYLGKEMIQNIMIIRFANIFFEPLWNNKYIDSVQISSSETVGVEDRAGYYEKSGALRDMVQNHMLQLLTLVAMEPPSSLEPESIRDEKAKVLKSLKLLNEEELRTYVIRGQYGPGTLGEEKVVGYRQEQGSDQLSDVETFVALKCQVENFRWAGVPFYLRTGKRLPVKSTEVVLRFKELPGILYFKEYDELKPNLLVIRIAPEEGVFLQLNAKKPGTKNFIVPIRMDFCQNCEVGFNSPEAYERLIIDALRGDPTLFTRWDEVENAWRFIDPIAKEWEQNNNHPLFPNYAAGSWGPEAARTLLLKDGRSWLQIERAKGELINEDLRYFHAHTWSYAGLQK